MSRRLSDCGCIASRILQAYDQLLCAGSESIDEVGGIVPIPQVPESAIRDLCQAAIAVFETQSPILLLHGDYYIIGDIHGNLIDLLRILWEIRRPPNGNLLFLGDMIDRGAFSTEVFTLILAYLVAYPDHVSLVRGNHEFVEVCEIYGFHDEFSSLYKSPSLWTLVQSVFGWMPVAAVIGGSYFCVHGGISESFPTIDSIAAIQRPILKASEPIADFFWGDPTTVYGLYAPSPRGLGKIYGPESVSEFLETIHLKQIIRAHEVAPACIKPALDGRVLTVFSTSDGAWPDKNSIAVLLIQISDPGDPIKAKILPPGRTLKREEAVFKLCCDAVAQTRRKLTASTSYKMITMTRMPSGANRRELLQGSIARASCLWARDSSFGDIGDLEGIQ
jgi:protein phosphatase